MVLHQKQKTKQKRAQYALSLKYRNPRGRLVILLPQVPAPNIPTKWKRIFSCGFVFNFLKNDASILSNIHRCDQAKHYQSEWPTFLCSLWTSEEFSCMKSDAVLSLRELGSLHYFISLKICGWEELSIYFS